MTSEAPQAWYVMLQDEAAAGRIVVPLRPYLKFSRRLDLQLVKLEKRIWLQFPQLTKRGSGGRGTWTPPQAK